MAILDLFLNNIYNPHRVPQTSVNFENYQNGHQMAEAVGAPVAAIPIWGGGLFEGFMGVLCPYSSYS